MPGTPCVWLGHWKTYKTTIKRLITVRRAVGITNQSAIITKQAKTNGYVLVTEGQNGNAALLLGSLTEADLPTGNYKLALEGTSYKLYVTEDVDLSALDTIKDETFTAPDFCTVADGEVCAFFEAPNSWSIVKCWAWDGTNNYTGGSWPGAACTKVGRNNGKFVWKWSYSGSLTTQPTFIIFNNNNNGQQTADLTFQNGGYYNDAGALQGIVTGIDGITSTKSTTAPPLFSLDGRRVTSPRPGIYIQNNKKIVIR
jgi:hypothetical protein